MAKPIRVPLIYTPHAPMPGDGAGETLYWTVRREMATCIPGPTEMRWNFTDHDGDTRDGGKTWRELVAKFSATADNYACTHRLS